MFHWLGILNTFWQFWQSFSSVHNVYSRISPSFALSGWVVHWFWQMSFCRPPLCFWPSAGSSLEAVHRAPPGLLLLLSWIWWVTTTDCSRWHGIYTKLSTSELLKSAFLHYNTHHQFFDAVFHLWGDLVLFHFFSCSSWREFGECCEIIVDMRLRFSCS